MNWKLEVVVVPVADIDRAKRFYAKHGFVPIGDRFMEAGIEHQTMRRKHLAAQLYATAGQYAGEGESPVIRDTTQPQDSGVQLPALRR